MIQFRGSSMRVSLGKPVCIAEGIGHLWFPVIHQFPSGELIAQWSMMPDIHCFAYVAGASHSKDGGKTWSQPYSFGNFANQCIPQADGGLQRIPYYIYPSPPGQQKNFTTDLSTVWPGGRNEMTPHGVRVNFPRDMAIMPTGSAILNFTGTPIHIKGRWLTTVYGTWEKDKPPLSALRFDLHVVESRDEGKTWSYLSTVAEHGGLPEVTPEGPCEASLCVLESGEVLCVFRVGSGEQWSYRAIRSDDGCRTWGKPEILSGVGSVEPSVMRLKNGALALSGGRPGIKLWVADDKVGRKWNFVDLQAHHNQMSPADRQITTDPVQSTCYTELLPVAPNKLLCVYDRCAVGWHSVPLESPERSGIYMVEVTVEV